jgi:hypothetical protein
MTGANSFNALTVDEYFAIVSFTTLPFPNFPAGKEGFHLMYLDY